MYFAGEVVCIPLRYSVEHTWPLPFGLLLQKSMEGNRPVPASSSLLNSRDLSRPNNRDYVNSQFVSSKDDDANVASHLILIHPMEEPQVSMAFFLFVML